MKKTLIITAILVLATATCVFAASPTVYFSDLDSGPKTGGKDNKGAFVTIWGKNFGVTRGTSYVSIGGGQADNYPVWSDTKISFQLGANAATGNITLTTSEGTSNGVPFTVRGGNIYFVSVSGSDSNDGSYASPWRYWAKAKDTMVAGDIVYGRGGNYTTSGDKSGDYDLNRCIYITNSGTAGNPITYAAYPGEIPVLYPSGVTGCIVQIDSAHYITISGLHLYNPVGGTGDVASLGSWWDDGGTNKIGNIRIVGNVAKKNFLGTPQGWSGSIFFSNGHDIYIAGNQISDVGKHKSEHGLYINEQVLNCIIEYNEIFDVHNGYGIEIYNDPGDPATNCIVRNNLIYRCGRAGIQVGTTGTYKIYNNVIWDCGRITFSGINLKNGNSSTTYEIYNNTLYDNGQNELTDGEDYETDEPYGQIWKDSRAVQSLTFRNNIIRSINSSEPYWTRQSTTGIQTFSNNLYFGNGGKPAFDNAATTLNVDPKLYNPTSDFHLQSDSSAINAGYDNSAIVNTDYDGIARPQSSGVDIGAYEYVSKKVTVN